MADASALTSMTIRTRLIEEEIETTEVDLHLSEREAVWLLSLLSSRLCGKVFWDGVEGYDVEDSGPLAQIMRSLQRLGLSGRVYYTVGSFTSHPNLNLIGAHEVDVPR